LPFPGEAPICCTALRPLPAWAGPMGNSFQLLDIILFAGVAGFLLYRLRSVLGRRTGEERPPRNPFVPRPPRPTDPNPINNPINAGPFAAPNAPQRMAPNVVDTADGLTALQAADPSFNAGAFLTGARAAFEIILKAFAAGDVEALRPLLSPDVFAAFAEAIRARQAAKETHETKLIAVKDVRIEHAAIEGGTALVAVKLTTDQINATRDASGKVVDGDPNQAVEKVDIWTFRRPLRSRDPNWTLVATHS
jgi:predicted lipid-binding transport protein (Tim44 family)